MAIRCFFEFFTMPTLSITKIFTFEAAHALLGYDGLCANIHGHSYRLEVTVCSPALDSVEPGRYIESDKADPKNGMLFDFSELKKCVNQSIVDVFDHALILNREGNAEIGEMLKTRYQKVFCVPFQPTSENLLLDFAQRLQAVLPEKIRLKRMRLYETATSYTDLDF